MQWIKLPRIYFERDSVRYLKDMPGIKRVFIVTGPSIQAHGYVDVVTDQLRLRENDVQYLVFSDVEADPSTTTVEKGVALMKSFKPDTIIALGGVRRWTPPRGCGCSTRTKMLPSSGQSKSS